ncbi:short-chain acyl-CoA dehydrogenase [Micromonospora sp. ATCC 39149]|uniref:Acyl-CoA/acyl-ACP dehydrogenase n=1 Tax=Micromonospora carbonacea TaxID=47853 RepID=A0A7D6C721_9ACTN|nr:acyl-CoA dehydrogenase family protein [Micromonospora sp. ATCC 39149]EEP73630.1 short-chain acyl-CoA dehydrogenase [Micromonospora sp. ATCC 39149]QLJ99546.1 acyl-CoA/acyl-ACP dehydrogenase [Micromonospora carbonacea]
MKLHCPPSQNRFVELADRLAATFRERARQYDQSGAFPFENFADLRESGYLGLTVPEELGGLGGDLTDMVLAQERLAAGCGSTALTVNMHLSMVGQLARSWRTTGEERAEKMLRQAANGSVVLAGATAEPGHALVRSTGSRARRVDGGYVVTGHKTFGTGCAVMTHMTSMAVYEEHPDGPHVLIFRLPVDTPGIKIKSGTWNTSGLRATRSENIELCEVTVPDEAVSLSFPVGRLDGTLLQTLWGWAMPSFAAVYLGIAVGAYEQCVRDLARRGWQDRAFAQATVAECEALIESARALVARTAAEVMGNSLWTSMSVQQGMSRVVLAKTVGTNNAVAVVDRVIQLVGSPALQAGSVYDRAQRDVRAGTMHPYSNSDACDLVAATVFGRAVAPENPPARDLLATADTRRPAGANSR